MKDSELSIFNCIEIQEEVERQLLRSLDRRTKVFVNPNLTMSKSYDGIYFSKKYYDLVTLILLTWYSDYFVGFEGYIRYEIELYLDRRLLFPELNASLVSKEIILPVLLFYSKANNPRILFGTILTPERIQRVLNEVSLRFINHHRVTRTIRRRGYKDKGSKRPDHKWLPTRDYSLDQLQSEIEKERETYQQEVTSIVRNVGGWVLKQLSLIEKEDFNHE